MSFNQNLPVLVYGESSAAVFLISQLIKNNESVIWATGSGAKLLPVMPYVKSELALGTLFDARKLISDEIFAHPVEKGVFHRVFRNKGFKLPSWKKTSDFEAQQQAFEELVWAPEQSCVGVQEIRISGMNPAQIEQQLRQAFETHPRVKKIAATPVLELEVYEHGGKIQFANGQGESERITEFKQFYFCDSLTELKMLPKLATVFKHQLANVKMSDRVSALQVVFHHSEPLRQEIDTGIVIPMNRDAGETFDRDVLGYFVEPTKSVWTVFMQMDEIEENHEIMKKLRKLKQSLNKAFDSPEFLPEGHTDFMSTVQREQVRFEEGCLMTEGSFRESEANPDFAMITDAFGFTQALESIARRFQIEEVGFTEMDADFSADPAEDDTPDFLPRSEGRDAPSVALQPHE